MLPYRWRSTLASRRIVILCASVISAALSIAHVEAEQLPDTRSADRPGAGQTQFLPVRFVIGLERSAEFQVLTLSKPDRVVIDLPDIRMQLPLVSGDKPVGLIKSFRGGQTSPGQARVVIDMAAPVLVEKAAIEKSADGKSARLVIDIAPAAGQKAAATSTPTPLAKAMRAGATGLGGGGLLPPAPKAAQRPNQNVYKPLIVLDPGHGGHDSGAQKYGTVEKDVVLAFSKILRDKLVASGRYRVLMTRDSDTFVELDERREFAERHKAALFIAVHADYASTSARGATIYSLRESVADSLMRSQRSAVRERVLAGRDLTPIKADAGEEVTAVKGFLADLAQREVDSNKDRTNVFAQSVIEYMGRTTELRDNPDKSAAFRVLKTAQVPAVLIELAYVSNQQDASNLRSDEWRKKVTESIMTAIDNYFADPASRVPM